MAYPIEIVHRPHPYNGVSTTLLLL